MLRKIVLVKGMLVMILLGSFALLTPSSQSQSSEAHLYLVMGGGIVSCGQMGPTPPAFWTSPFATRQPDFSPTFCRQEITFSDPDPETGLVDLAVPAASYVGVEHVFFDENASGFWLKLDASMVADGYGWLFTGTGTTPILGDVDCYTYGDNSGVYWGPESPFTDVQAAGPGELPGLGSDGIAGTDDDGFGDGTTDPVGSSILFMSIEVTTLYWDGTGWRELFSATWPQIFTTGNTYHIVIEPESELDGVDSTAASAHMNADAKGEPWEFLAGFDHSGQDVDWDHPNWNAYVTYVCSWSILDIQTILGDLDVMFQMVERKVREDLAIADINGDETVDIFDIVTCSMAFGTKDEGAGPDGLCDTADDKPVADKGFNAKVDIKPNGEIDIFDIVAIAGDFGKTITPEFTGT